MLGAGLRLSISRAATAGVARSTASCIQSSRIPSIARPVVRSLITGRIPIRNWADPVSLPPSLLRQFNTTSSRHVGRTAHKPFRKRREVRHLRNLAAILAVSVILYYTVSPFRHTVLATVRCARLMQAVLLDVIDYKSTFAKEEKLGPIDQLTPEQNQARRQARKDCHQRSADRMLKALKKNSGIYVKLGQHVAAVQLLPAEWTVTMTPLQDQCFPTPMDETDAMLRKDLKQGIDDLFSDFDPNPIGVASLAQVHRAIDKRSGRPVAVKVQHADLEEFARVDMVTVNFAINLVKYIFPEFEFSWLGDEMNHMLPLEMDFRQEAHNSARCKGEFAHLRGKTSVYLPEVLWADRRCLVMEFIDGARVDNLAYLKKHSIDRNQVSQELSRIFSQMVYLNGHFHADPHHGNLLIRPRAPKSHSPFNFDVCLLDHGQYFDIPDDLRVNYARFWLSLLKPSSKSTNEERRKYAKLVGNIDDDMYPILESAITGRMSLGEGTTNQKPESLLRNRKKNDQELQKIRAAVMEREGLIQDIFELLRRVPKRLLMILKLSDLQRSLDNSLATTHGPTRIFVIVARYCADAVWQADLRDFRHAFHTDGLSFRSTAFLIRSFFSHLYWSTALGMAERYMDLRAQWVKTTLWFEGLRKGGLKAAEEASAGLLEV